MKFEVGIGEATRVVQIEREAGGGLKIWLDGTEGGADVIEITPNVYSIRLNGLTFEASVVPEAEGVLVRCGGREFHCRVRDPRAWRSASGGALEAEGRQQVAAPMPGQVVRVLVAPGEAVEARQGLVVVEAMKMQNEIRSPKAGQVERIFVREGQSVRAGEPLLTIS